MTAEELDAFLRSEGLWQGPVTIEWTKGGYLNQVLCVRTGEKPLAVKRFPPAMTGTLFPNLPHDEAKALQRLAGLKVAPEFIGFWPEQSILVYDYVDGQVWEGDQPAVADLLSRKEAADPAGFRSVPMTAEAIMAEGDTLFARCSTPSDHARPAAVELDPPARLSLIHTDIAPNLIGAGPDLRLIDWQCPAMGDLCEDVHSFLSPAFQILGLHPVLSDADVAEFLHALDRPDITARYAKLRPAYAWRMAAYCHWRAEVLTDPEVCERYRRAEAAELAQMELPL